MIRPIYFDLDDYFCEKKIAELRQCPDISPGGDLTGDNQCILQNACTQTHHLFHSSYSELSISEIPHIKFSDVLSGNYDDNIWLEISSAHWYILKDRSWVKGKKIIVTMAYEGWIRGIPMLLHDQNVNIHDPGVLSDLNLALDHRLVRDNASKIEGINTVPYHGFYVETRFQYKAWVPKVDDFEKFVATNIERFDRKPKKYTSLLGRIKPARTEFFEKIFSESLEKEGYIGGYKYRKIPFEQKNDNQGIKFDRYVARQWLEQSKLWIVHETHCPSEDQPDCQSITQLSEKTWKPIAYGMPFVVNTFPEYFDALKSMGFNPYDEVFGNYIESDFSKTNDNIIDIIKNIDKFDANKIKNIARHNYERFTSFTARDYNDYFFKLLDISYD